jgi:RNA recognition motif-containing protein
VNNLNEKLSKERLREALYLTLSQFGIILDIKVTKTLKLRGQAWICFEELRAAVTAVRDMPGFVFFNKPMQVQFAKSQSHVVAKIRGTYVEPAAAVKGPQMNAQRQALMDTGAAASASQASGNLIAAADISSAHSSSSSSSSFSFSSSSSSSTGDVDMDEDEAPNEPHNTLFLQSLPEGANEIMLSVLFKQYDGFQAVRLVPGRAGIGFVDFGAAHQAGVALESLRGFKLSPTHALRITYAKK